MDARTLMVRLEEADKMLRRGEMAQARAAYASLLPAAPPELQAALQSRIQRVDELSGPAEGAPAKPAQETTLQAQAEAAVNEGRIDDAIDMYATLIASRPDDQLARERMTELLGMKARNAKARFGQPSSRVVTMADASNANIAGAQESGPLGRALDGAHAKPLPATKPTPPVAMPAQPRVPSTGLEVDLAMDVDDVGAFPAPVGPPPSFGASLTPQAAPPPAPRAPTPPTATPFPAPPQAAPRPTPSPFAAPMPSFAPPAPPPAPKAPAAAPVAPAVSFTGPLTPQQPLAAAVPPVPSAPKPPAPPAAPAPPVVAAPPAPRPAPAAPLPADPVEMLQELLRRVADNRRSPSILPPIP
ncbi:MAG: hypothetical protein AB2A00_34260 [Myxococcota bacterium]